MKTFLIAALLVLASSPLRAQPEAAAFAAEVAGRGPLLQDLETWRAMHLARSSEKIIRAYTPRLAAIKKEVAAAQDEAGLAKPKKAFEAWKTELLLEKYSEAKAVGMTGGSDFTSFRQEQSLSAGMMSSIRTQIQMAQLDGGRAFDGSLAAGGMDAVTAPSLLAFDDPARYAKIRAIMISQGAKPKIVDAAIKESIRQKVDPALTLSVIWQESRFKAGATSPVGARGLMQVMPATGRDMGVADASMLYDVKTNLRAGIGYLKYAAKYLKLNVNLADITEVPANKVKALLASYNAGIGAVSRWLRSQGQNLTRIPYAETRHYVRVIGDKLSSLIESLTW